MRRIAAKREVRGESEPAAGRHLPAPADRGGDALQHRPQPAGAEFRPAVLRIVEHAIVPEHREPQRQWILPGGRRNLVEEALHDEGIRSVRRRAPGAARNAARDAVPFEPIVWNQSRREIVRIQLGLPQALGLLFGRR